MRHELHDWFLPVRKAALADAATCGVLGGESCRLLVRGAIRLCLPVAEEGKIEKNRNRPCLEPLLQVTVLARIKIAPRRPLNSPPVSILGGGLPLWPAGLFNALN